MTERIITEIADKPWEVVQMRVKDLKPNPDNPRIITEEDFKRLKRKIKRQGFRSTIMLDNDGVILGGNQRYNALMDLGYQDKKIPVMIPLFKMTEKERQEAIITDNISDGSWNNEMLANQYNINDLLEWGMDTDWIAQPPDTENPEQPPEEFDVEKQKVKIVFFYKDSHEIIDKFLREIKEKYPELLYTMEISDQ